MLNHKRKSEGLTQRYVNGQNQKKQALTLNIVQTLGGLRQIKAALSLVQTEYAQRGPQREDSVSKTRYGDFCNGNHEGLPPR